MASFPILRAAAIQSLLKPRLHPLDSSRGRDQTSLGDQVGLTKTAVHQATLAPGKISTLEHFHDVDEEWYYILGGSGTLLCAGEGEDTTVRTGDFVGFPASARLPHALQAGAEGLSYLCGGTREPVDFCHYPLNNKAMVINRVTGTTTVVDE
ncbi:hypothetical protein FB45DRAFT_1017583 [Roridomyces roridus]|uniref:Cupin type-2 domain-containing protein n=1 Tax=Roridomyces roridus TaxID=1738132 RepID=A0AAD7CIP9_9AGAR|nr:hypothetical protein FB45DRAFT_1017583 [Roridomyces roridus]